MTRCLEIWLIVSLLLIVSCAKDYSYEGGPQSTGYLVKDNSGGCSLVKINGDYKTGTSLTGSNSLQVLVYVEKKGDYHISSGTINGFGFSGTGNFNDTGIVEVTLTATGLPIEAETNLFTVNYGLSFCEASIAVQDTAAYVPTNEDHFPLTTGSYWLYDDLTFPGDSITNTVLGDTTIGLLSYKRIDEYKSFYPAHNRNYYTKQALEYFTYTYVSRLTSALNFSPSIYDDFNYLKEGLTTGFTWSSKDYSGRTSIGVQVKELRYIFKCLDAEASFTVNNMVFNHVYKIQMFPEVADQGLPLQPTGEIHTFYYAQGVGLIYQELFNGVLSHPVLAIRKWEVK
jgi:hypothetical protein